MDTNKREQIKKTIQLAFEISEKVQSLHIYKVKELFDISLQDAEEVYKEAYDTRYRPEVLALKKEKENYYSDNDFIDVREFKGKEGVRCCPNCLDFTSLNPKCTLHLISDSPHPFVGYFYCTECKQYFNQEMECLGGIKN